MSIDLKYTEWDIGQIACIALLLVSISSGLILLILIFTKILPSTKKKNISIRIPKLMNVYLYITSWILLITIPITSTLFCFIDYKHLHYEIDNYIGAILFIISIIPLILTHISRFGLLRIQHGISNATMSFNLGEISWHEYVNKFEIILQEDYNITNPSYLRKYTIYISIFLITISIIILYFTHPFFYIWINVIWLGIISIFTAIIVWVKSDNFNIKDFSNRFKLDSYSILKEMHHITIILLIHFIIYLCICVLLQLIKNKYININNKYIGDNIECSGTVLTHIILMIGLSIIWIIQLKYALRALFQVHKAVPLTQLLSSYDGYKAFLRFLVSELSIENLEFFQLSMRWRYRICCWLYGVSNGTKQPEKHINLPFKIFSFQYIERLLPQQNGGGLVPNYREKQNQQNGVPLESRDSEMFFTTLPLSRKASVNSHFQSPYASNHNSRTTTPKFGSSMLNAMSPGGITAPSSLHYALPPTIVEGNDEEEMELTRTATATYMLQAHPSYDEDNIVSGAPEYSQSLILNKNNDSLPLKTTINNKLDVSLKDIHYNKNNKQKLKNHASTPPTITNKSSPRSIKPTLSPLTMTAPTSMDNTDNYYRLRKIPREDEIIDINVSNNTIPNIQGATTIANTPGTMIHHTAASPITYDTVTHINGDSKDNSVISPEISQTQSDTITIKNRFKPPSIVTRNNTNTNTISDGGDVIVIIPSDNRLELLDCDTDLSKQLTPVQSKPDPLNFKTSTQIITQSNRNSNSNVETPNTPEPMVMNMPDIQLHNGINDINNIVVQQQLIHNDKSDNDNDDDDGMEYMDDYHQYRSSELITNINQKELIKKKKKGVRFASTIQTDLKNNNNNNGLANKTKDIQMIQDDTSPACTPKHNPMSHIGIKNIKPKVNMHDLLGGHGGINAGNNNWIGNGNNSGNNINNVSDRSIPGLPLEQQNTETFNRQYTLPRDESVASKAAEPSWFAAWFRKGNVAGGQQERADTLLHYSDLSWRRLKKVSREVNMSAIARGSVDSLFKKYTRSRYLETKGITLSEYDESMRDAWVSAWENMNDSLRRFAKSGHYEKYLASIGQLTIKKVVNENINENGNDINENGNDGIAIRGNVKSIDNIHENDSDNNINVMNINDTNFNGSSKKLTFNIRIRGKSKTEHSRAPAVIIT